MLINFSVSNFLSFDDKEVLSMVAGKARKHADRLYSDKRMKLAKCEVIFGANASGKSNLISAIHFMQCMVATGLPRFFSEKYFRMKSENKNKPSVFEIEVLLDEKRYVYGFELLLKEGIVLKEYMHEHMLNDRRKLVFDRDTKTGDFNIGPYFKDKRAISKLENYGEDSGYEKEELFLKIISKNKRKMFEEFDELNIFRRLFIWFIRDLEIGFPENSLTDYPCFDDYDLEQLGYVLNALGTGISEAKIMDIPLDVVQGKFPKRVFEKLLADLERIKAKSIEKGDKSCKMILRGPKKFYTFEVDDENHINARTIEFSHEADGVYFDLNEESDGTARLLDLIEILIRKDDNRVFIIDEIDRCLHPIMTVKIIELFLELAKKRNAQLIITTHESRLLEDDLLRNDEICFLAKNFNGATIINPLEKLQLRSDKKLYAALFDGTLDYGPKIKDKTIKNLLSVK